MPPKASPKPQTISPQTRLVAPANRDHGPNGATNSKSPIPTWIHTAAAAAVTGCSIHSVPPKLTRCCTHVGDPPAAGWSTWEGTLSGMADCPCRIPSNSQIRPKPIRSTRWATGSGGAVGVAGVVGGAAPVVPAAPLAVRAWNCLARSTERKTASTARIRRTTRNCSHSAW
jgi:hypothetical protein